jgi:hypothetical protein
MPVAVLGSTDDKAHKDLLAKLIEQFEFYAKQLDPIKHSMSRYTRLYLGERKDPRRENEKWRSNTWLGDPFQQTETEVAVWISILNSQTPTVTAEGVGSEDEWKARGFTNAVDYIQRGNSWTYGQEQALRKVSYQGWTVIEPRWRELSFKAVQPPTKDEKVKYDIAVNEVMKQGAPPPPDAVNMPDQFALWTQQFGIQPPQYGPREVVQYRGPWWARNSDYDYYFDPFLEDWTEQEVFIKRVLKPWAWLEKNAGPEEGKRYDPENLAKCKGGTGGGDQQRLSQWEREIAARQGLTFQENDPIFKNGAEVLEFWRVKEDLPFCTVVNRTAIVNKRPDVHPYWHGQLPFVPIRNIPLAGRALGMSSYSQMEKLFGDRVKFRDLLFDMMLISVMPILLKKRGMGLADMQKQWQPGMVLDVNEPGGIQRAIDPPSGFAELVQVTQMILQDQNLILSTGENVRGQQAQVGRVSATEAQARLTQALVRHTQRTVRLEEEFNPIIPQSLALIGQKWPSDDQSLAQLRAKMVGANEADPWADKEVTKELFVEALTMDIKFTGASRTRDLQLAAQQIKDFTQFGASIQVAPGVPALSGVEIRNLLRRMYRTLGQKGVEEALTTEGDQAVAQATQLALSNSMAQAQLQALQFQQGIQQLQNPQPPPQEPGPEATIQYRDTPPDVKRQLEQRVGLQPSQMGDLEVAAQVQKAQPRPMPQGGPPRG